MKKIILIAIFYSVGAFSFSSNDSINNSKKYRLTKNSYSEFRDEFLSIIDLLRLSDGKKVIIYEAPPHSWANNSCLAAAITSENENTLEIVYNLKKLKKEKMTKLGLIYSHLHELGHLMTDKDYYPEASNESRADSWAADHIIEYISALGFIFNEKTKIKSKVSQFCEINFKNALNLCIKAVYASLDIARTVSDIHDGLAQPELNFKNIFLNEEQSEISPFGYPKSTCRWQIYLRRSLCSIDSDAVKALGGSCQLPQCALKN